MNAIVTGSSNGLGLAIAKHLASQGINVAVSARKAERLEEVLKEVGEAKSEQTSVFGGVVDFGHTDQVRKYVNDMVTQMGKVDILLNNAGIYREDTVNEDIEDSLKINLDVNLFSSVRMNDAIRDHLNESGYIINIVSIAAMDLRHDAASYTISKVALRTFTEMQREAYRDKGIKVVGIFPGAMNTRSWDGEDVDASKMIQTSDICNNIMNIINMSDNTAIEELIINPVEPVF